MCHLFAHQPQRDYKSQTRSLRMGGHCTSIRLEMSFWDTLEEIAAKEGMSLAKFLTTLHDEVLDHHGEVKNFASLLRCSCLIYRAKSAASSRNFAAAPLPFSTRPNSFPSDRQGKRLGPSRTEPLPFAGISLEVVKGARYYHAGSRENERSSRSGLVKFIRPQLCARFRPDLGSRTRSPRSPSRRPRRTSCGTRRRLPGRGRAGSGAACRRCWRPCTRNWCRASASRSRPR